MHSHAMQVFTQARHGTIREAQLDTQSMFVRCNNMKNLLLKKRHEQQAQAHRKHKAAHLETR